MNEIPVVTVTLEAIFNTVQDIDKKIDPIPKTLEDHEVRMRQLERDVTSSPALVDLAKRLTQIEEWRWKLVGAATAVGALSSVMMTVILKYI